MIMINEALLNDIAEMVEVAQWTRNSTESTSSIYYFNGEEDDYRNLRKTIIPNIQEQVLRRRNNSRIIAAMIAKRRIGLFGGKR